MYCSRCGTQFPETSKFCPSCGLEVGTATTPVRAVAAGEMTELDIVREALSGEYEISEELGRGGMAIVYRAKDKQLEREVAIKVLPFSLAFDSEFVERFQREARTAAQLEHPNIIPIYRVGKSGRVIYFVMKFLRGKTLSRVLHERTRLSPPEIRRLLTEAGSALGYAAKSGIVHRDIKPDNIMFDEFGTSVVADFGIAKAASGQKLTGTGMSIGTPHYMSPEQARAQPIDGRSDVYSLGIVAYQCLTGQVPYDGEDSFSIGYKHIMEPIPTPQLTTGDERALFEVIKQMIMKDPHDRFQTSDELIASLEGHPIARAGASSVQGAGARAGAAAADTTPLPKIAISAPTAAAMPGVGNGGRRPGPPRPAPAPAAKSGKGGLFFGLFLLLAAGGGGAYYQFVYKPAHATVGPAGGAPVGANIVDSVGQHAATPLGDSTHAADSARQRVTAPPPPVGTPAAAPVVHDSGTLLIKGVPGGSVVFVDDRQLMESPAKLPVGSHEILIRPPVGYQEYRTRIEVEKGKQLVLTPTIGRAGQGRPVATAAKAQCSAPLEPNYNADQYCFDEKPHAHGSLGVPYANTSPSPSILWVHVGADGATAEVLSKRPSNDAAFEQAARDFARSLTWSPATKGDNAVDGWIQVLLVPVQQ
ncbi:MAG TPA: protein kinase [Gemmatimonadales bacterium]|nr:protein kinase [Gemmatimonadales bacterium]